MRRPASCAQARLNARHRGGDRGGLADRAVRGRLEGAAIGGGFIPVRIDVSAGEDR